MSRKDREIDYEELGKIGFQAFWIDWKAHQLGSGTLKCNTEDDAKEVGRFLIDQADKLNIHLEFTTRNIITKKWVYGYDCCKMRVANSKHRVFIVVGGTDCDGVSWCEYYSFSNIYEAAREVDEILSWADGPTDYSTISIDEWENGPYPECRDRFAEAAGY